MVDWLPHLPGQNVGRKEVLNKLTGSLAAPTIFRKVGDSIVEKLTCGLAVPPTWPIFFGWEEGIWKRGGGRQDH